MNKLEIQLMSGKGVLLAMPFKNDFSTDVEASRKIINFQTDNGKRNTTH